MTQHVRRSKAGRERRRQKAAEKSTTPSQVWDAKQKKWIKKT